MIDKFRESLKTTVYKLKVKAKEMKRDVGALYLACRRPDVPWYAKLVAIVVVGYALSPLDLIPDFIPVIGLLDDLILVPMGIALAIRLIPVDIMTECREQSQYLFKDKTKNWIAGGIIIFIWIALIFFILSRLIKI